MLSGLAVGDPLGTDLASLRVDRDAPGAGGPSRFEDGELHVKPAADTYGGPRIEETDK